MLAGLQPVNGIYVSFFQMIVYLFTGTSRHISVGTFAIISLLTATSINKYSGILYGSPGANSTTYLDNDPEHAKLKLAMALSFGSGILSVIFAVFHVGVVTKYLSDTIVNGFTCGAAYQIVASQAPNLLGIKIPNITSPFVFIAVIILVIVIVAAALYLLFIGLSFCFIV